MAKYKRGMKAGILSLILTYTLELVNNIVFTFNISYFLNFGTLLMIGYSGAIYGTIIGFLFVKYYDKLHGKTNYTRAIEIILIVWFIFGFVFGYLFDFNHYSYYYAPTIIPYMHGGFLLYVVSGFFYGVIWNKLEEKQLISKKKKSSNLKNNANSSFDSASVSPINKRELEHRLELLRKKNSSLFLTDVEQLVKKGFQTKTSSKDAEALLHKKEKQYESYTDLQRQLEELKAKITRLTVRVAEGEVDSDSYKRALDDLESQKRTLEEELWKLRNKLFKDEYEKPF